MKATLVTLLLTLSTLTFSGEEDVVCVDTWWDEPNLTEHCVRWMVIDYENCLYEDLFAYPEN